MDKKVNINLNTEVIYHGDKTFEKWLHTIRS